MRKLRLTERRIALICAVVLVLLSVTAAFRQQGWWQRTAPAPQQAQTNTQQTSTSPSIDSPADTTTPPTSQTETPVAAPAEQPAQTPAKQTPNDAYSYTAVSGSSYTEFARQAITDYAAAHKLTPSPDQVMSAEISLTNNAGAPLLEIGQAVTIERDAVAQSLRASGVTLPENKTESTQPQAPQASAATKDCSAVVNAGDSYTLHARQCITTYLQAHNISLTPAQRAAAESQVTTQAGSPLLEVSQTVTIANATMQQAITSAQQLSAHDQAIWQTYADTIAW